MDAVAALPAGAAQGRIHFGHRRLLLPRHHARRRDAHHRHGGDERLPQGAARQDPRPQRPPADPAAGIAADRLGGGRRAHQPRSTASRSPRRSSRARRWRRRRSMPRGVLVRGMRAADLDKLPSVANNIKQGTLDGFDEGQGVAIGRRLADQLSLRAGDNITLVAPRGAVTPMGTTPRIKAYKIAARVRDRHVGIRLRLRVHAADRRRRPISTAPATSPRSRSIPTIPTGSTATASSCTEAAQRPIFMIDWRQRNATFFNALQVERNVMFLILTLIVLVAALNIVSGLIMLVKDKGARHRDPAHHGRDAGRDHAGLPHHRRVDRRGRHAGRASCSAFVICLNIESHPAVPVLADQHRAVLARALFPVAAAGRHGRRRDRRRWW